MRRSGLAGRSGRWASAPASGPPRSTSYTWPEVGALRTLIEEELHAGFYNIDVDTSTLVDLSKPNLDEQQRDNYERAAQFTQFIREREPAGVTVSVGAEIGEVGGKNSDVHELQAFMDGYNRTLKRL